jgi:hypothetical protein
MEDWVRNRHKWSPLKIFTELHKGVEGDVASINELLKENEDVSFRVVSGKSNAFSVCRHGPHIPAGTSDATVPEVKCVEFMLTDSGVVIDTPDGNSHNVVPSITDDGEFKMRLGGDDLDCWQLRKRILDDLFFNLYPNRR